MKWFFDGFRSCADTIETNHISSRLLYEYLTERRNLDQATLDNIREHLAGCPYCSADLENMNDMNAATFQGESSRSTLMSFKMTAFPFPRNIKIRTALSAAASLIIVLAILYASYTGLGEHSFHIARVIPAGSALVDDAHVYGIPAREISRGEPDEAGAPFEISLSEVDTPVLRIDPIALYEPGLKFKIRLQSMRGNVIWESPIREQTISSGSILLMLNAENIAPGRYEILIVEYSDDGYWSVVSTSHVEFKP